MNMICNCTGIMKGHYEAQQQESGAEDGEFIFTSILPLFFCNSFSSSLYCFFLFPPSYSIHLSFAAFLPVSFPLSSFLSFFFIKLKLTLSFSLFPALRSVIHFQLPISFLPLNHFFIPLPPLSFHVFFLHSPPSSFLSLHSLSCYVCSFPSLFLPSFHSLTLSLFLSSSIRSVCSIVPWRRLN